MKHISQSFYKCARNKYAFNMDRMAETICQRICLQNSYQPQLILYQWVYLLPASECVAEPISVNGLQIGMSLSQYKTHTALKIVFYLSCNASTLSIDRNINLQMAQTKWVRLTGIHLSLFVFNSQHILNSTKIQQFRPIDTKPKLH